MRSREFNFLVFIPIVFLVCIMTSVLLLRGDGCSNAKADKCLSIVMRYSNEYGVNPETVLAIIRAESGFDSDAISSKGAVGLMQILPKTASYIAEKINYNGEINLKDANCNIMLGCAYLSYLQGRFGSKNEVICAYNAGEGIVNGWLRDLSYSSDGKRLSKVGYLETRKYLNRVLRYEKEYKKYLIRKGYYAK